MSSFNEFYRYLLQQGYVVTRTDAGSCIMMTGPNGKKFPFHNHGGKEMSKDTQKKILKQAGIKQ